MRRINEYVSKDIIKNKFQLVEIYHVLESQLERFGSVEVSIRMKELAPHE